MLQVKLHPLATEYFGFAVPNENGDLVYYKYLVLPFGCSSAVWLTERLLRPVKLYCHLLSVDQGKMKYYIFKFSMVCLILFFLSSQFFWGYIILFFLKSIYIDDGLSCESSYLKCLASFKFSTFILLCSGWKLQLHKCVSIPTTKA